MHVEATSHHLSHSIAPAESATSFCSSDDLIYQLHMSLNLIHVDPHIFLQVEQRGQPVVVYECKLHWHGIPCGMFIEGTNRAVSAHLRGHGITGPEKASTGCTWGSCSKTLKRGSLMRHILAHLGVKVRCSVCGVVKCRHDLFRKHIKSSEPCRFASADMVDGPEGYVVAFTGWFATN